MFFLLFLCFLVSLVFLVPVLCSSVPLQPSPNKRAQAPADSIEFPMGSKETLARNWSFHFSQVNYSSLFIFVVDRDLSRNSCLTHATTVLSVNLNLTCNPNYPRPSRHMLVRSSKAISEEEVYFGMAGSVMSLRGLEQIWQRWFLMYDEAFQHANFWPSMPSTFVKTFTGEGISNRGSLHQKAS